MNRRVVWNALALVAFASLNQSSSVSIVHAQSDRIPTGIKRDVALQALFDYELEQRAAQQSRGPTSPEYRDAIRNRPGDMLLQAVDFYGHKSGDMYAWLQVIIFPEIVAYLEPMEIALLLVPYMRIEHKQTRILVRDQLMQTLTDKTDSVFQDILVDTEGVDQVLAAEFLYGLRIQAVVPVFARSFLLDSAEREAYIDQRLALQEALPDTPLRGYAPEILELVDGILPVLSDMASDDRWWVRLDVAMLLKRHPALRAKGLVDTLKADENEVIRTLFDKIPRFELYRRTSDPDMTRKRN